LPAVRTRMTISAGDGRRAALIAFADGQKASKKGPVGAHGYCMSGPYALAAAARLSRSHRRRPPRSTGTWLVSDAVESPHLNARQGQGRALHLLCEHDELAPPDMVKELKALFDKSGNRASSRSRRRPSRLRLPARWCYDKAAAERHWERLIALYRRRLG